jgi:Rrf2 family iron-sulfur cluster assembly transcriptional regulator
MSGLLSKTCEYAVQAVIYMADRKQDEYLSQHEIANALNIPPHFLGKILQSLARNGLVVSVRGKFGGFQIAKKSTEITILDIIEAVEGKPFLGGCLLGLPGCNDKIPCFAHTKWGKIKGDLIKLLDINIKQYTKGYDLRIKKISKK